MARHEADWRAAQELGGDALPALMRELRNDTPDQAALVCFLARAEGWRDAGRRLSGAFAKDEAERLRQGKGE